MTPRVKEFGASQQAQTSSKATGLITAIGRSLPCAHAACVASKLAGCMVKAYPIRTLQALWMWQQHTAAFLFMGQQDLSPLAECSLDSKAACLHCSLANPHLLIFKAVTHPCCCRPQWLRQEHPATPGHGSGRAHQWQGAAGPPQHCARILCSEPGGRFGSEAERAADHGEGCA